MLEICVYIYICIYTYTIIKHCVYLYRIGKEDNMSALIQIITYKQVQTEELDLFELSFFLQSQSLLTAHIKIYLLSLLYITDIGELFYKKSVQVWLRYHPKVYTDNRFEFQGGSVKRTER